MAKQAIKGKVVEVLAGDESYDQLLVALIQNGYSPNNLKNTLNKLNLNTHKKKFKSSPKNYSNAIMITHIMVFLP